MIALLLGVLAMTGEYRHQTITTTFLSTPRRRDVVIAKLGAQLLTGALIGASSVLASAAVALPWLRAEGIPTELDNRTLSVAAGVIASAALYGTLGVSIGALIRNQTAAFAAILVWLLAIEGAIGQMFHDEEFVRWLPVSAARDIVGAGATAEFAAGIAGGARVLSLRGAVRRRRDLLHDPARRDLTSVICTTRIEQCHASDPDHPIEVDQASSRC